jgi:glycosyltransferase involved in cell wall biosynthesis
MLLDVFRRLRAEIPEARLDIVGRHPPLGEAGISGHGFLRLAMLEERVRLVRLLGEATCFVLPSRYEASALAYVEACAAGLPCIGTAVGGSRQLIGPGGCVVDPTDPDALLAAMRELCDPETASRLGAAGRRHAALFTWDAVAGRILRALRPEGVAPASLATFL